MTVSCIRPLSCGEKEKNPTKTLLFVALTFYVKLLGMFPFVLSIEASLQLYIYARFIGPVNVHLTLGLGIWIHAFTMYIVQGQRQTAP